MGNDNCCFRSKPETGEENQLEKGRALGIIDHGKHTPRGEKLNVPKISNLSPNEGVTLNSKSTNIEDD